MNLIFYFSFPYRMMIFFTINLDMYFFPYKGIGDGIMNIFHANSRLLIHNVFIDLKTVQVTGKRLQQ